MGGAKPREQDNVQSPVLGNSVLATERASPLRLGAVGWEKDGVYTAQPSLWAPKSSCHAAPSSTQTLQMLDPGSPHILCE